MILLTSTQLAERLVLLDRQGNPNAKGVKRLMQRWGVLPFPLGVGAGLGYRWDWEEIQIHLEDMRQPTRPCIQKQRVDAKFKDFFKKPYKSKQAASFDIIS